MLSELIPKSPEFANYKRVVTMPNIPVLWFFINSLFVSVAVVVLQVFVTSLAAFALARKQFKGRDTVFSLFLIGMMFSGVVTQIPVYLMVAKAGFLDTYAALILPSISSSFAIFLLRQYFRLIPMELDEAARLDGASDWRIYSSVIMPLSKPALATVAAFAFFASWTDFFWPLIATNRMTMRTAEVGLSVFKNSYQGNYWPLQMAAAVITLIPMLILFLWLQRFFLRGIVMGSIK